MPLTQVELRTATLLDESLQFIGEFFGPLQRHVMHGFSNQRARAFG